MIGLRKKSTYDELINYIEIEKPKIRFPDRTATLLRNSHYLSQFDGNLFDVEEQQKNITKAQLKENEIRNIISNTRVTTSILRSDAAQEQNRETTEQATRRSNAENDAKNFVASVVANSVAKATQRSNAENDAKNFVASVVANSVAKKNVPQMFDIAADDKDDEAMEQADAVMEAAREKEDRKNDKIKQIVATHLGEEVKDLPYIQQLSNLKPNPVQPAEVEKPSRSRSPKSKPLHGGFTRGKALVGGVVEKPTEDKPIVVAKPRSRSRSPNPGGSGDLGGTSDKKTQKKVKEDTGGENTKRRGRSKSKAPTLERTQSQKRISTKESTDAPAKAKAKAEQKGVDEKKIMSELKKAIKAEEKGVEEKKFMSELKKGLKAAAVAAASSSGAASSNFNPNPSTAAPKAKSRARAKSQAPKARARADDDDNVEISGVSVNDSQDMKYWKAQSANEIRAQFKLRDSKKYYDEFAFKTKVQLLDIIKELIKKKQW